MLLSLSIAGPSMCQTPKTWMSTVCMAVPPVTVSEDDQLTRETKQSILKTNKRLEAVCHS